MQRLHSSSKQIKLIKRRHISRPSKAWHNIALFNTRDIWRSHHTKNNSKLHDQVNSLFLSSHKILSDSVLKKAARHYVVSCNGNLSLWGWRNDKLTRLACELVQSNNYHEEKTVAHIPVTLNLCVGIKETEGEAKALSILNELHAGCIRLRTLARQNNERDNIKLINTVIPYINSCIIDIDNLSIPKWEKLNKELGPLVGKKMRGAVSIVHANMAEVIDDWKNNHNLVWHATKVAVVAPHGARRRLIEETYLRKLLEAELNLTEDELVNNLLFSMDMTPNDLGREGIVLEEKIIKELVAPSLLNITVGETVLNNKKAMFEDVLADEGDRQLRLAKLGEHLE